MQDYAGGQYRPLPADKVGRLHESALRLLEEVGVKVALPAALEVFAGTKAVIDPATHRVRIPARLVESSLKSAPGEVRLCGRDPQYDLLLHDARVHMGTGGAAVRVIDPDTEKFRPGTLKDIARMARLVQGLDNVHFFIRPCTAQDVPREQLGVHEFYASIRNTTKHVMGAAYTAAAAREIIEMASRLCGGEDALREKPFISFITSWMVSPLSFESDTTAVLMEVVRRGLPVALSSAPMAGSTAPITMAGTLTQLHAEELAGLVFCQLLNPGTPVLYGGIPGMADMHDLSYKAGGVEFGLMNAAISQLANYIGIPNYCSAGITEAKIPSLQAIYEKTFSICQCALAGANYIHHAAGSLESLMTVDYGQFVIDNEIIGMALKMVKGIDVDEDHIALDVIAGVGPGGTFLDTDHTLEHLHTEYLEPMLAPRHERNAPETLQENTHLDVLYRARANAEQIIETVEVDALPDDVDRTIRERYQISL